MAAEYHRKQSLGELTERILASYEQIEAARTGSHSLPAYDAVIEIAGDLKQILLVGHHIRRAIDSGSAAFLVGNMLNRLHDRLTEQIASALHHKCSLQLHTEQRIDVDAVAQKKAIEFLGKLPHLRTMVALDAQAALDGDPAASSVDEVLLCYPGLDAIAIYRLAHELFKLEVPLIPRMLTEWAHSRTGIDIHPGAQIGSSFFIDHGTGVVIGATCEIADSVKLYQGVTLGALSFPRDEEGRIIRGSKRHPTIEDNVVIYANATVLGGTTVVGAGSIIGASVSLTRSVAPNTVVTIDNKPSLRFRQAS